MDDQIDLKDFSFVSAQCPAYPTRKARAWSYIGAVAVFMAAVSMLFADWAVGGPILAVSIAWFAGTAVSTAENKFYVTRYELKDGQLTIEYTEKGEPRTLSGRGSEFAAQKKRNPHRRGRSPCLVIYRKNVLQLEQRMIGDWNESLCDSVVLSLGGKLPTGLGKWL